MTGAGGQTGPDDRPGDLTISGGGSTLVATDVVFAEMAALRLVQDDAEGWHARLGRVSALGVGPAPGWRPNDLGACVFGALAAIDDVAERSRALADALAATAEDYGRLEGGLAGMLRITGSWLGYTLGALGPLIALSAATPLAYLALGSLLTSTLSGRTPTVVPPALTDWMSANPQLLTSPLTVALVRTLASSADDAALGRAGVPFPVAALLGDGGAGLLGAASSALGLLVAGRAAGMLRDTPVRVTPVGASAGAGIPSTATTRAFPEKDVAGEAGVAGAGAAAGGRAGRPGAPGLPFSAPWTSKVRSPVGGPPAGPLAVPLRGAAATGSPTAGPVPVAVPRAVLAAPRPPTGFADLADRIPTRGDGGQVRVERYGDAAHPSWVVYLGGTLEWSPTGSTEPWDMTSNVTAVAGQESGSYAAVLQAMQAAGVAPSDPVLPVAHSQGGLLAVELAARGDANVVGLVTFGAPAVPAALPEGLPAIAIEHSDDIIPSTGGAPADDDGRLYVRRELFANQPVPADATLPAHQMTAYQDTARLVDESEEPRLLAFRKTLADLVGTEPGAQTVWHAERVG
ncbi:hypothetical protein [Cryobacterium sp. PAMC25264]|uniref:hypothetical protein n=1 Tax=Cryobacterium sp. PAMC25264 TaxID=2861288 RepID=UPI001C633567|nr:hypothetical protein [Cryobacterium sp. PAMC25264]QYF73284.1 hypothetical protein KY500_16375 [Cryobacterium sp. PAMC25264]